MADATLPLGALEDHRGGSSILAAVTGTVFSDNLARSSDVAASVPGDVYGGACTEPLLDGGCPPVTEIDATSIALDQGSCAVSGVSEDARGVARPFDETGIADADDGCDIGAYEWDDPSSLPPPSCDDCDVLSASASDGGKR